MRRHLETLKSTGLVITVFAISAGCSDYRTQRAAASPSSSFSAPPAGLATICVFRPHGLGASVVTPVSDNGSIVGATDDSSRFCYHAEPGPHRIRTADSPKLSLSVEEGKSYYLAHDLNVGPDSLMRIKRESAEALSAWCGEVEVEAAPKGVAVLKRGEIARADYARPLQYQVAKKPRVEGTTVATDADR